MPDAAVLPVPISPALVVRAQAGDEAAFEAIFAVYYPRIASYCCRLVGDAEAAQDLAQETFIKAYHALPRTRAELNLQAWLFTIATNTALSALRQRRRRPALPLQEWLVAPAGMGGGLIEAVDDRALLQAALDRLPRAAAALLLLRLHYGMSYEELAPLFGGSVGAVKTRLSRARRAFRESYLAAGGHPDPERRET